MIGLERSKTLGEDERGFLQRRVGIFALASGGCYLIFLLFRIVMQGGFTSENYLDEDILWHLGGALVYLAAWGVCRKGTLATHWIRSIESVALLGGSLCFLVMGSYIRPYVRPDQTLLLALSLALTSRAVFVPSSPRRSFLLALSLGAMLCFSVHQYFLDFDVEAWAQIDGNMGETTARDIAFDLSASAAAWWLLYTIVTTAASRVIFGLRREVRDSKRLGQYQLEAKIGEGGMGEVYRAHHALLRRPTAVKLLRKDGTSGASLHNFEKEVQHTARLNHPNIITIFDYGHTVSGTFYYAMELLEGVTLGELVKESGPQSPARSVAILRQVVAALVYAHGEGLIHRDIKPANIMMTLPHRFGGVKERVQLLDFGLVREIGVAGGIELSRTGTISGTPQYMSPEAITAPKSMDERSDIYAVGAVAYFLLTGEQVFSGATVVEVCSHHLHSVPMPLSERLGKEVPAELEALVLACLAKDREARPSNALALGKSLEALALDEEWSTDSSLQWWNAHQLRSGEEPARGAKEEPAKSNFDQSEEEQKETVEVSLRNFMVAPGRQRSMKVD